ncbi:hypothetical protein ACLM5H_08170 [Fredinandcohnia humi]
MKNKILIVLLFVTTLLPSCNTMTSGGCPPHTIIEWVDMVKINDITYQHDFVEEPPNTTIEKGKTLGEVTYKMADNACTNHKMKNGDAAFLDIGTPIYEIKGSPTSLMVSANNNIYIVDKNEQAILVGDLYPVQNLVKNIHFQSEEDGSRIHTFTEKSADEFLKELLPLKLHNPEKLYKNNLFDGERVFIEIELKNGVSFRLVYWKDSNTFSFGAIGNDKLKQIIQNEKTT